MIPDTIADICQISGTKVDCDAGNPDFYNNPYPAYEAMREIGPFYFWEQYGFWCTVDHELVSVLLRDRRFGRILPETDNVETAPAHLKPFYRFERHSMLELEPPEHTRLRKMVNRAFVSRHIETQRPVLQQLCHDLIDSLSAEASADLISQYAQIIPVHMIATMIGVPTEDCHQLLEWSHKMVAMYQHNRDRAIEDGAVEATQQFSAYIREHIHDSNMDESSLLSLLANKMSDGDELSEDELITTVILLLNAGHEATVHGIGNAIKTLLENDVDTKALFDGSLGIGNICDELLRFDPPLHQFTRFALEDVEIAGQTFVRGEIVGLMLAGANRDSAQFPEPHSLNFSRTNLARQTAFGAGVHFCVGAPLARLEMQIALPTLFNRLPNLKLSEPPKYADRYHFHGLERLLVSNSA